MKRIFIALMLFGIFALAGCGGDSNPPAYVARILSDPLLDGDIEQTSASSYTITQGMSSTVQSVFAGIDYITLTESQAFLHFPLRGAGGVPGNAIIASAFLDILINSIEPFNRIVPIRIELVSFPPPLMLTDFDRTILPPLAFTTILPPISPADVNKHVSVDVTPLMTEAQRLGLINFQVRIMEDLGPVLPGIIEINDTIGANREVDAPLLEITYF